MVEKLFQKFRIFQWIPGLMTECPELKVKGQVARGRVNEVTNSRKVSLFIKHRAWQNTTVFLDEEEDDMVIDCGDTTTQALLVHMLNNAGASGWEGFHYHSYPRPTVTAYRTTETAQFDSLKWEGDTAMEAFIKAFYAVESRVDQQNEARARQKAWDAQRKERPLNVG